jgi:hypothetical protein
METGEEIDTREKDSVRCAVAADHEVAAHFLEEFRKVTKSDDQDVAMHDVPTDSA